MQISKYNVYFLLLYINVLGKSPLDLVDFGLPVYGYTGVDIEQLFNG